MHILRPDADPERFFQRLRQIRLRLSTRSNRRMAFNDWGFQVGETLTISACSILHRLSR